MLVVGRSLGVVGPVGNRSQSCCLDCKPDGDKREGRVMGSAAEQVCLR
jgi:hypothetical protein